MDAKLENIKSFITEILEKEWTEQGHSMNSGKISSLEILIDESGEGAVIDVYGNKYLAYINQGTDSSKIPFSPGSGKKTSKYIQGLQNYAKKRFGLDEKESLRAAFAIAYTQKREGMPTNNSYSFSNTGYRKDFIGQAFENNKNDFDFKLIETFSDMVKHEIDIIFK